MQNVCFDVCSFVVPWVLTRLDGVPALYMFTQYEADFIQDISTNSLGPSHIYLSQGFNFLEERVKMHICTGVCIFLPLTAKRRNLDSLHHW